MSSVLFGVKSDSFLCSLCKELCRSLLYGPADGYQETETQNITTSGLLSSNHYGIISMLQRSIKLGCHLCSLIWRSFQISGLRDGLALLQASYHVHVSRSLSQIVLTLKLPNGRERDRILGAHPGRLPSHLKKVSEMYSGSLQTGSTSSQACFDLASSWLHHCLENHPKCSVQDEASSKLPSRLLHLKSIEESVQIRLCCEEVDENKDIHYLTLSHCWGKQNMLTLTKASLESFKTSIPFHELPLTFCDAIKIALKLGFEYLWIDCLCIIQDDEDDWQIESSNMGNVYRNGVCNIAALGAHGDDEGCFAERAPLGFLPLEIRSDCTYLYFEPPSPEQRREPEPASNSDSTKAPLMDRAWVLQEVVLSPRTIYYGSELLFWECVEGASIECQPWMQVHRDQKNMYAIKAIVENFCMLSEEEMEDKLTRLLSAWEMLLKSYTSAKLTYQSDRWLAIAGLAGKLAETANVSIMAGLWKDALLEGLLWHADKAGTRIMNGAPHWSWLSLDAPIQWWRVDVSELAVDLLALPENCSSGLSWTLIKNETAPADAETRLERYPLLLQGRLRQFHIQPASVSSADYPITQCTIHPDILPWPRHDPWGMLYSHDFPLNHVYVLLIIPLDDYGLAWTRVGTLEAVLEAKNIYNELSRHTAGKMLDEFGPLQTICLV